MKKLYFIFLFSCFSFFKGFAQKVQNTVSYFDNLIKQEISRESSFSFTETVISTSDFITNTVYNISSPQIQILLDYSKQFLGINYRRGGESENGFDCSGFVRYCFNMIGVDLPRSSQSMSGEGILVDKSQAQPGDLIFFSSPKSGKSVGHVGIVSNVSNGMIEFIHSAWSTGVRYDYLQTSKYFNRHFIEIRRVVK